MDGQRGIDIRLSSCFGDVVDKLVKDHLTLVLDHLVDALDGATQVQVPLEQRSAQPDVVGVHGANQGLLRVLEHTHLLGKGFHVFAEVVSGYIGMLKEGAELFAAFSESLVLDANVHPHKTIHLLGGHQLQNLALGHGSFPPSGAFVFKRLVVLDPLDLLRVRLEELVPHALVHVEGFVAQSFDVVPLELIELESLTHLLRGELLDVGLRVAVVVVVVAAEKTKKKDESRSRECWGRFKKKKNK